MADKTSTQPATGGDGESSETDDKTANSAPATGAGTKPETGSESPSTDDKEWVAPTREEWEASQASIKRLEAAQKKANKEAEDRRKALDDAEKAKMTEAEQKAARDAEIEAEREALKVERAEIAIEREVTRLAPRLNLIDSDAVVRLLDWDKITFEDGKPGDGEVEREVKNLLADRPYLASKAGPAPARSTGNNASDATSGSGPKPDLTAEELSAAEAAGMSPERYATLRDLNRRGGGVTSLKDWSKTRPKPAAGGTQ